jgi:site-specific recombinase XerD
LKYVTVGFNPHDDFKIQFILWDIKSNKQIILDLQDIFKIQIFLTQNKCSNTFLELSTANMHHNTRNAVLYHIQEKTTMKTISTTHETMMTLVQSKHLYQYPLQNLDFLRKADNIIEILNSDQSGSCLTSNDLRKMFHNIYDKMVVQDKIFLSELIFKFPTTLLAVINKERKPAYSN